MTLNTAAAAISFARKLEEDAANFYEAMGEKYGTATKTLQNFARENRQFVAQIERTYYGVISDALEGCFSFAMNPEEYALTLELPEKIDYAGALAKAIDIEGKIIKFYAEAARQSKALMADVPRVFELTARKHDSRQTRLEEMRPK